MLVMNSNTRYFGVALGVVVLALVAIGVIVTRPTGNSTKQPATSSRSVKLSDYENQDASLSVTIQGQLVGDTKRRSIRMIVTPEDRGIELLDGYNQSVDRSQHYPNTQAGYVSFLHALTNAGFLVKKPKPTITDDLAACPLGNTYIYDLYDGSGHQISHLWGDSCSIEQGTFGGLGPSVRMLFQKQIDDYDTFIVDSGVFPTNQ
jgi:hypothetical protein